MRQKSASNASASSRQRRAESQLQQARAQSPDPGRWSSASNSRSPSPCERGPVKIPRVHGLVSSYTTPNAEELEINWRQTIIENSVLRNSLTRTTDALEVRFAFS